MLARRRMNRQEQHSRAAAALRRTQRAEDRAHNPATTPQQLNLKPGTCVLQQQEAYHTLLQKTILQRTTSCHSPATPALVPMKPAPSPTPASEPSPSAPSPSRPAHSRRGVKTSMRRVNIYTQYDSTARFSLGTRLRTPPTAAAEKPPPAPRVKPRIAFSSSRSSRHIDPSTRLHGQTTNGVIGGMSSFLFACAHLITQPARSAPESRAPSLVTACRRSQRRVQPV